MKQVKNSIGKEVVWAEKGEVFPYKTAPCKTFWYQGYFRISLYGAEYIGRTRKKLDRWIEKEMKRKEE